MALVLLIDKHGGLLREDWSNGLAGLLEVRIPQTLQRYIRYKREGWLADRTPVFVDADSGWIVREYWCSYHISRHETDADFITHIRKQMTRELYWQIDQEAQDDHRILDKQERFRGVPTTELVLHWLVQVPKSAPCSP